MDALIIKKPWIDMILSGKKTWEIRGMQTQKRGRIALIESGSGTIVGEVDLVGCIGPLFKEFFLSHADNHCIKTPFEDITYKNVFAWVLANPHRYDTPKPYDHPNGAIIWVKV